MSAPIPTLGYRSKSQAAVALRDKGFTWGEIARKLNVSTDDAYTLARSGRRANGAPRRPAAGPVEVKAILGAAAAETLTCAAEARKAPVNVIAARVLTLAARDGIIDAILDDGKKS